MSESPRDPDLDRLADDLGRLTQRLLERVHADADDAPQVGDLITRHLGPGADAMPVVESFEFDVSN